MAKFRSPFNTNEIWLPIKGYEGLYEVSDMGRVKSLARRKRIKNGGLQPISEHFLTNSLNSNGYYRVNLWKNNSPKHYFVHRLVAEHFLNNPENKRTINHKDGNPKNNSLPNLEWATDRENIHHAMDNGLMDYKGDGNPMSKLTESDVRKIKMGLKLGAKQKELAKIFKVSDEAISNIKRGRNWSHIKLNIV